MPKSLAFGHTKVAILRVKPNNMEAPTLAEVKAGIQATCRIEAAGFKMGAVASATVSQPSLCDTVDTPVMTSANAEASFNVFRYFSKANPGQAETAAEDVEASIGDELFQFLKTRGTRLWAVKRLTGKEAMDDWAVGDEVETFEIETDHPFDADLEGFIRKTVPMAVRSFEVDAKIVVDVSPAPVLTTIAPTTGPAGTEVVLTGTGFTANTTVWFDNTIAPKTFVSATELRATVPTGLAAGAVDVTAVEAGLTTAAQEFTVTGP